MRNLQKYYRYEHAAEITTPIIGALVGAVLYRNGLSPVAIFIGLIAGFMFNLAVVESLLARFLLTPSWRESVAEQIRTYGPSFHTSLLNYKKVQPTRNPYGLRLTTDETVRDENLVNEADLHAVIASNPGYFTEVEKEIARHILFFGSKIGHPIGQYPIACGHHLFTAQFYGFSRTEIAFCKF